MRVKRMTRIAVLALAAGSLGTWENVAAQNTGEARRGLTVAQDVCADCHAIDRNASSSPNVLAPTFRQIVDTPGMTELALYAALRTPHPIMPNLLPDSADVNNVIAYIRSLQNR